MKGETVVSYFYIKKINISGYDRFLLWLSFEGIMDHLGDIEKVPIMLNSSGKILIDQLFITGDEKNRFICCNFRNGKLDFKTLHIVDSADFFRKETVQWLHDNYSYVEHSILTEGQRQKVKDCIAF